MWQQGNGKVQVALVPALPRARAGSVRASIGTLLNGPMRAAPVLALRARAHAGSDCATVAVHEPLRSLLVWVISMSKTRVVIYMDPGVLGQVDRVADRSAVSRSAVISAAVLVGIDAAGKQFPPRRQGQGNRLFGRPPGGYFGRRRAPPTSRQRTAIRFGETLLKANPSLQPDALRALLVSELPTYLPDVPPDSIDFDELVDALYASHDGNLVAVPGQEPPDDLP